MSCDVGLFSASGVCYLPAAALDDAPSPTRSDLHSPHRATLSQPCPNALKESACAHIVRPYRRRRDCCGGLAGAPSGALGRGVRRRGLRHRRSADGVLPAGNDRGPTCRTAAQPCRHPNARLAGPSSRQSSAASRPQQTGIGARPGAARHGQSGGGRARSAVTRATRHRRPATVP